MKLELILPSLASLAAVMFCLPCSADTFTAVNYGAASASEQDAFDRINNFRADPRNELHEMFVEQGYTGNKVEFDALLNGQMMHTAGWWVDEFGSNIATNSMDAFGVVPSTLNTQFAGLPEAGTLSPYTWSDNIGWSAHQYSVWVENHANPMTNPHAIPGAPSLGARLTDAGVNWSSVQESIAPDWNPTVSLMHMGFGIDWGEGDDGIQDPPGHRNSMLSSDHSHLGIGIVDQGWTPGEVTQVQHFVAQFSTDPIVYGYVTDELSGDALSGVTVNVFDSEDVLLGTTTTDARGAYTIQYAGGTPSYTTYQVAGFSPITGSGLAESRSNYFLDAAITAVPEPQSMGFLLAAAISSIAYRRKK